MAAVRGAIDDGKLSHFTEYLGPFALVLVLSANL